MDPLVFEPYFRPQIWGGRRLERYLGRPLPGDGTFGEAWVLSTQALHVSRVAEGPYQGVLLTDLWKEQANALTGRARPASQFPLLLKYLDCQELLSIQVHPNNEIANRLRPGELGKTEAWVVLDADPAARVYAGLQPGVTRERMGECLAEGSLADCLHSFVPRKGDCVFLNAGTVHAVGGGVLMAEVQQTSDATFRLFDWNRLGTDGKPRTLHTAEALLSIDWSAGPVEPTEGAALDLPVPNRGRRLVACPYFTIDRFELAAPLESPYRRQMSLWMVLEGSAELSSLATGYRRTFRSGETVLAPATAEGLVWNPAQQGPAVLLGISH
jgi:mannose-6-phosphate isomerase